MPTLVIHGDADRILPIAACGINTHRAIKDSRLVVIEKRRRTGCGGSTPTMSHFKAAMDIGQPAGRVHVHPSAYEVSADPVCLVLIVGDKSLPAASGHR
jgi:hypothetical protein